MKLNISGLIFLATFLIGILLLLIKFNSIDTQQRQALIQYLTLVQSAVDSREIDLLQGTTDDYQNPGYYHLQTQLTKIASSYPNIKFLYLMRLVDNQVIFLVDSQSLRQTTKTDLATPGEIYEDAQPSLIKVFSNGKNITVGPETDKWGTFISALGPIRSDDGKIIAVVGADVDSSAWKRIAFQEISSYVLLFVIILGMELFLIRSYSKFLHHQISITYLANVMETSNDAIYSYNLDGIVKSWNLGAQKIYGYSADEAIGQKITDLIFLRSKTHDFKAIIDAIKSNQRVPQHQVIRRTKSKQKITILITESPIIDSGNIVGVSVVAKDVTLENHGTQTLALRNQKLEKLNQLMIDRELKMIELKQQLKQANHK